MKLIGYNLELHKESDKLINGLNFSLKVNDAARIIDFFKKSGKWNEYYYYEFSDYDLNLKEVNTILNFNSDFWQDDDALFYFSGFTIEFHKMTQKNILIFQSYDKINYQKRHFYQIFGEDEKVILENDHFDFKYCQEKDIKTFENINRKFDFNNYEYKIETLAFEQVYFFPKDFDNVKLEKSENYDLT